MLTYVLTAMPVHINVLALSVVTKENHLNEVAYA